VGLYNHNSTGLAEAGLRIRTGPGITQG